MSQLQNLVFFSLLTTALQADTVLWKADGTLSSGTGVFLRNDLSPDDPVTIRMTYDDGATQDITTNTFGRIDSDYWQNIDLKITISTGDYTWEGTVETANMGIPYTFFTRVKDPFPTPESLEVKLSSVDQGEFSSFPFRLADSTSSFFLDLRGANSSLLDSGIRTDDIHPEHLTSATGKISTGVGNDLSFSINPDSLEVINESEEIIPPVEPKPSIAVTPENVSLTWPSDFRYLYRVESTTDLSSDLWTSLETRNGTGATISRSYPLSDSTLYYRVVAIERPPAD